jgi:hypothetical protein
MADINNVSGWIDDFGPVREDNNKVTEEAVQRVQAQSKQAKQIAQQIKKDKAINNQLARFLTMLMQKIENEELIKAIVSTFFKTTDQRNQITYLRKDINIYVVVWFFVPFFQKEAEELKIMWFYENLGVKTAWSSLEKYIVYLWKVSEVYHDNIPIDQWPLITLIILIAQTWIPKYQSLGYEEVKQNTMEVLYWGTNKK